MTDKCEVCNGYGRYPVINWMGLELYSIRCPQCWGKMHFGNTEQNEDNKSPVPDAPEDGANG